MKEKLRNLLFKNLFTKSIYLKLSESKRIIKLTILLFFNREFKTPLYFFLKRNLKMFIGKNNFLINDVKKHYYLYTKKLNPNIKSRDFLTTIRDCEIIYINLKHRADRNMEIIDEFKLLNIEGFKRFNAIKSSDGLIGCALSHVEVLEQFKHSNKQLLMVCEDDLKFMTSISEINELINEFNNNDSLSVLCLASNHYNSFEISSKLSLTTDSQTTSCYIIKKSYIDQLISIFSLSTKMLEAKIPSEFAALDMIWKINQSKSFFVIPNKRIAFQRESFSDIERKIVDYRV